MSDENYTENRKDTAVSRMDIAKRDRPRGPRSPRGRARGWTATKAPTVSLLGMLLLALAATGLAACGSGSSCVPDCTGRACGPDPVCGQSCGSCTGGAECRDGVCGGGTCQTDADCGPDENCSGTGECQCRYGSCQTGCCHPAQAVLQAGGVLLADGALSVEITVAVSSQDGTPLAGVPVALESDPVISDIQPAEGATLADGRFTFTARANVAGGVGFTAKAGKPLEPLGQQLQVMFGANLEVAFGELHYVYPGALLEITATAQDAAGPVGGVALALESSRGATDRVAALTEKTGDDGKMRFVVQTEESGPAVFSLSVAGISALAVSSEPYLFGGPRLSGLVGFPQPDGLPTPTRVALAWINRPALEAGTLAAREATSISLGELVPEDQVPFALEAPFVPPETDFYRPAPSDPTLPATFEIATYAPLLYADVDGSGSFSATDKIVGWREDRDLMLLYARGELPPEAVIPGLVPGYQFIRWTDEEKTILPLAGHLDDHPLWLRGADCPSATLRGSIRCIGAPPAQPTYACAMMIAPSVLDNVAVWWNRGNQLILACQRVTLAADQETPYQLVLPAPATVDPGYTAFLARPAAGWPLVGALMGFVFADADADGAYTNMDDNINTGDRLLGVADFPLGYGIPWLEWVQEAIPLALQFAYQDVNRGYNLALAPLDVGIQTVVDDYTLELARNLNPGGRDLCFRIVRRASGTQTEIMRGDDLATGSVTAGNRVTSAAGGFAGRVQPNDRLIFCNQIEKTTFFDLDTDYPMTAR
ncbi:MAG: hypothetical protein GYA21_07885 [Myxococcales bacterium]|nr:hypothetical protein [Myxococcales bacterium]